VKRLGLALVMVLALSGWLHAPLFSALDAPYRDSIEGGYQSMARFVAAHPHPWGWNPTQYGGLPTHAMYLPVMPYTAAVVSWVTGVEPALAHRRVSAAFAVLGPCTVLLFVWYFTRSLRWAVVTGVGYLLFSPLYGLVEAVDRDRGLVYLPWRLQVLVKYGEGPHNAALTLLPLALMALWRASTRRDAWSWCVAAVTLAGVVLTNWVGALALAITSGLMLLAVWGKAREHQFSFRRAFAAAALAYGLAAFWLTPSFIQTVAFNWPKDAYGYQVDARTGPLLLGWWGGLLLIRMCFWGRREVYLCWLTMSAWAFGYLTVAYYSWSEDVLPESRRYALEFELFLFLGLGAWLWHGLRSRNRVEQFCAALPLAVMLLQGRTQMAQSLTQSWADWKLTPREASAEYRITQWLAERQPRGRIFASGGLRFRMNAYAGLAQAGGVFESGLRNRVPLDYAYQIRTGLGSASPEAEAADAVRQLQALGVEYVVVHGVASAEYYRDYKRPEKFTGVLEQVAAFGADVVYRVPFRSLAALVRPTELPAHSYWMKLGEYGQALADTARPAPAVTWHGPSELTVSGVPAGGLASLAVSWDPGWRVEGAGRMERNALGWMTVSGAPAVRLRYGATGEQKVFALVTLGSIGWAAWRLLLERRATAAG